MILSSEKIEKSKEVMRLAAKMSKQYYKKPLVICYSGGKDSDVLLHLACECLEKDEFRVLNAHTTVDAPETVYHIRSVFKKLTDGGWSTEIQMPIYKGNPISMWTLIPEKRMPPTRIVRYCCEVLKEASTPNQVAALGVRADESRKRKGRDVFGMRGGNRQFYSFEHARDVYQDAQEKDEIWDCQLITGAKQNKDMLVNPIYEWTNSDVWQYIRGHEIKTNPLYECGFDRVGCVLCPMGGRKGMLKGATMFPKYAQAYKHAFQRMIDKRKKDGLETVWNTGQECFDWWIGTDQVKGQISIDEYLKAGV